MNTDSVVISQAPPERISQNYTALRESGMAYIRELAKESWTDHNLHDPGITLLEVFSYAMTELGFRVQLDIPDLLRSGMQHALPDLQPAHRVLPCSPVTPRDLRMLLLDHPQLRDARLTTNARTEKSFFELSPESSPPFTYIENASPAAPHGLYEVNLEFRERALNSNTYTLFVGPAESPQTLDIALPYWDEGAALPLRNGPSIDVVTLLADDASIIWHPLTESQSFYAEVSVDYTDAEGSGSTVLWIILRIVDDLINPIVEIPSILAEASTQIQATGEDSLIQVYTRLVQSANGAVQQIQHYLASWRNLCEDPVRIMAARVQEIAVDARIEVTGGIDVEQILADIFVSIDQMLVPPLQFIDMVQLRKDSADNVETIFDGPLLRHGFLDDVENITMDVLQLYTSDILRLIMLRRDDSATDVVTQENPSGRNIIAVTDLTLSNFINNRPITEDAQNCLNLVETERYRPRLSLAKSNIVFVRNDEEVPYSMQRVTSLFTEKQQANEEAALPVNPSLVRVVAQGELLPVEDYVPLQFDLPSAYGVGEARLPDNIDIKHRSAVLQLKGYLHIFEQFLADLTAELGNINRFFSSSRKEKSTYFSRALFDLPDVQKLLVRSPSDPSGWNAFIDNPQNPHIKALQEALEGADQFLDRRNRMLDHLLARQGEEMVAFSQELHRYAQKELLAGDIEPGDITVYMQQRRRAANTRLIYAKAALLQDAPRLNNARLQAFGNPTHRVSDILGINQEGELFHWTLSLAGQDLMRSVDGFDNYAAALIAAEEAVVLASQVQYYIIVNAGSRKRYQLEDSSGLTIRVIAQSPQSFASEASAQTAAESCAEQFALLRIQRSLTPMEQRIAHHCGIRANGRRHLLNDIDTYFEIYDEVDTDGIIEKRWRLWENNDRSGHVMLSSVFHFEGSTDDEAEGLARGSIDTVLRYGHDEWNYTVSPAGSSTYNFDLWHPSGDKIGMRSPPFPSEEAAYVGLDESLMHLYQLYSAEGFHLIEHLLLRPRQETDEFLSLPETEETFEQDPYSQRVSLVFPSGFMRDYALPVETAVQIKTAPHRFRDVEFRRHAERMVQQACPAHILPDIYWVDRQVPGTTTPDGVFSFDNFEQVYFDWLNTILIPGAEAEQIHNARNALIRALNGIANAGS